MVGRVAGAAQSWAWDLAGPSRPFAHLMVPSPSTFARAAGSLIFFDALLQGPSQDTPNASTSLGGPEATLEPPTRLPQVPRTSRGAGLTQASSCSPFLTVLGASPTSAILFCHLENIPPEAQVSRAASAKPGPSYLILALPAGTWILGGHCCEEGKPGSHLDTEDQTGAGSLGLPRRGASRSQT